MKRIRSACLIQTVHFQLKDNVDHETAVRFVRDEYEQYKSHLEKTRTQYRILSEETQPDGSILIEIKKQYNNQSVGSYLE